MSVKHCTLPWMWLVFDADGNAMPCGQARGVIGNLREQSAEELWNGRAGRQVRRALPRARRRTPAPAPCAPLCRRSRETRRR